MIRQMMEESSKTLTLSGLSGIAVGCCALVGAAIAYFFILQQGQIQYDEFLHNLNTGQTITLRLLLAFDALFVLSGALLSAWYLAYRNCRQRGTRFWTPSSKLMIESLFSVLATGGIFTIILFFQGYFKIVVPAMLLFYGVSLLNASKYSQHDIKTLAYVMISLGLLATALLHFGLIIWTLGFGVCHIIYGIVMYYKYERNTIQ
jgi:hypothetical protein